MIIILAALVILGTPLLLLLIGLVKLKRDPQTAKILFILAAGWVIIGGGICATLIM